MIATIIITIIWTLGAVLLGFLCYVFNGMWGTGKIVWIKVIFWPIYISYRLLTGKKL